MDPRAENLCRQARGLPPPAQKLFLDEQCAHEPQLRAEVEALLGNASDTLPVPSAEPAAEAEGSVIGHFKLLQKIGEGGFGTVWMAEQREPVKRRVALKILKPGMDTRQVLARFDAERQALAMMDHPNIARVFDAGATQHGRPYFAMEYIRGVTILEYCDREKLDTRRRLELFMQVCNAIQHAHQKGVIHRDIKPTNVLVTLHDGVPVPKVIDFGVAKALHADLTDRTLFTEHRQIIGTPAYMSPEQAEMSGLDIDTRSDIYSLGVLLYELLTGTTPFAVEQLLTKGIAEMVRVLREEEPELPSTRLQSLGTTAATVARQRRESDQGKLRQRLRGDLDWIAMKCLEKDRTRRYDTANGLAMDIRRHLEDEPVSAGPPSAGYRLSKFVRRNRAQVVAGGVVFAALLLGIVGTAWGLVQALDEKRRADEESQRAGLAAAAEAAARVEAQQNADKARKAEADAEARAVELAQVAEFQSDQLSGLDAERMGARLRADLLEKVRLEADHAGLDAEAAQARVDAVEKLVAGVDFTGMSVHSLEQNVFQPALDTIGRGFADQPLVRARLDQALASILARQGLLALAEKPQIEALEIRRRELGADDPLTIDSLHETASLQASRAQYEPAERNAREALERSRRVLGAEHLTTLDCMTGLAMILGNRSQDEESHRLNLEALAIARRVYGPGHPKTVSVMLNVGAGLQQRDQLGDARQLFQEVLAIERRNAREDGSATRSALGFLAVVEQRLGNFDAAEGHARAVLDQFRRTYGDDHRDTLIACNNLGWLLRAAGRYDEAERYLVQAFEGRERVLGDDHQHTLASMRNLGVLYLQMGRLEEAERWSRRALDGMRRTLGPDNMDTNWALNTLGKILHAQKRYEEAVAPLREAADGYGRLWGAGNDYAAMAIRDLSRTLLELARPAEALTRFRDALTRAPTPVAAGLTRDFVDELRADERFASRPDAWLCLDTLAMAEHAAGNAPAAVDAEEQALALLGADRAERADCEQRLAVYRAAAAGRR
ncbi:MAG: serine/threonine protein kinase [Planctomycetes bacterium]|nr:serine/threonine protein kinase [Planctomycetota bacterium]